jgi:hypothetical protein
MGRAEVYSYRPASIIDTSRTSALFSLEKTLSADSITAKIKIDFVEICIVRD